MLADSRWSPPLPSGRPQVDNVAGVTKVGPELDAAREQVVERGLTADAVSRLVEVVGDRSLEALAPVKQQLKRFFSSVPWTEHDDEALATAIGPGAGGGSHELAPGLLMQWGFERGRFRLRIVNDAPSGAGRRAQRDSGAGTDDDLGATFDGDVIPEATPSPRTIRFATAALHEGPSRVYESGIAPDDARVARVFDEFDDVTNVLVGPDFVAVTLRAPDRWEAILAPMLHIVGQEFGADRVSGPVERSAPVTGRVATGSDDTRPARRLERAWAELGSLRAGRPADLERVVAASHHDDAARRQVAAALLADAPVDAAASAWRELVDDPSRAVRRSAVDAAAGAQRPELRPLLEHALRDDDAWIRWKALRGIGSIGTDASRAVVAACTDDPDFRVRLEAARVLAG